MSIIDTDMDREPRERGERGRPPLAHVNFNTSTKFQKSYTGRGPHSSQTSQTGQGHGVLTTQRKRSVSRSSFRVFRSGSKAHVPVEDSSSDAAPSPAGPLPSSDEPPSGMIMFAKLKNRLLGGVHAPTKTATASRSSARDVASPVPTDTATASASASYSNSDSASASESIYMDTSSAPLGNGSTPRVVEVLASADVDAQPQPQPAPAPAPVEDARSQPPKTNLFVLEPPPPFVSSLPATSHVQQPPSRVVPTNAETAPPVRPTSHRAVPRTTAPQTQKQLPAPPPPPPASDTHGGGEKASGLKKLFRTSSLRARNTSTSDQTRTPSATAHSTAAAAGLNSVPPPPAAIGRGPSRMVGSNPAQQTPVRNVSSPGLVVGPGSVDNEEIPLPPPPIQSHPSSKTSSWEVGANVAVQLSGGAGAGGGGSGPSTLPPQQKRLREQYRQEQQYPYVVSSVADELDHVRQQCIGQVALLYQRDAQIAALSSTVDRLRLRVQDQFQQQLAANEGSDLLGAAVTSLPDSQVRSRWIGLRWQVRQCAETALASASAASATMSDGEGDGNRNDNGAGARRGVSPTRAAQLRRLSPDYAHFLQSHAGTVCLVEAAVWTVLAQHVFGDARRASPMCWAGPPWKALCKISDNLLCTRPADPAFHQWRAQTAVFVASTRRQEKDATAVAPYVDEVVRQLEAEVGALVALAPALAPATGPSERGGAALRRQLFDIVADAVRLDADLCQQRAWFYVNYPQAGSGRRYGMPLDAHAMEAVELEAVADAHSSTVSLVVRPSLLKAGNSRGEAYDEVNAIERSVVCRAPVMSSVSSVSSMSTSSTSSQSPPSGRRHVSSG